MLEWLHIKMVWRGGFRQDAKAPRRQENQIQDFVFRWHSPRITKYNLIVRISKGRDVIRVRPRSSAVPTASLPSLASWRLGVLASFLAAHAAPRGEADV